MSETDFDFKGCWRLVDYEFTRSDGMVFHPWGEDPEGKFIVDEHGFMSAQIMRRGRPAFTGDSSDAEVMRKAYSGYMAYFGRTRLEPESGRLITRVEGSLNPNWVGGEQVRYFSFQDGRLTLRTPPIQAGEHEIKGRLTWVKEKGAEKRPR